MTPAEEKARAEVDKLAELERGWSQDHLRVSEKMQELERTAGGRVLDAALSGRGADASRKVAAEVNDVRTELETLTRSIDAARHRRLDAIPKVWHAQAQELREQAALKRTEADELDARSAPHLAALKALQGLVYVPGQPPPGPGELVHGNGDQLGGAPTIRVRWISRADVIRQQALELEQRAAGLQAQRPRQQGNAEAPRVEELVAAVQADPMSLAPSVVEVIRWAKSGIQAEQDRRRRLMDRQGEHGDGVVAIDAPLRLFLVWRHGKISADSSVTSLRPVEA